VDTCVQALLERVAKTTPSQIGHFVQDGFMSPDIKPIEEHMRVLGPAFTLRIPGNDNSMYYYALQFAPEGSVIVIDRMGERRIASVGEMAVRAAMATGAVGIVVDGPNTDTLALRELGLPVFSTGRSAATNCLRGIDGQYEVPVNCGGAVVSPGDIIYGDLDGVIVVPPSELDRLVDAAEAQDYAEETWRKRFEAGESVLDFVNIRRLVDTGVSETIHKLLSWEK